MASVSWGMARSSLAGMDVSTGVASAYRGSKSIAAAVADNMVV